ncbi:MAG: excinuclease ABC subunit UvrC [Lentisphaeria bacterium]|nr:excinuclease ABC subunit UvrC [Lentisphaeria bacterium]
MNAAGEVIYVGKARNLRSRMSSYFRPSGALRSDPRRRALIHSIASYEIFPVATEAEALLLEAQFIKQYTPRYNVELRDDKRFLLVCVNPSEAYPRLTLARIRRDDNRLYFGPFPQATALREAVQFLSVRYRLRTCKVSEPGPESHRHCLEQVIRGCMCPCLGAVTPAEYGERLGEALAVLRGEAVPLLAELHARMQSEAAAMDFEAAARTRDLLSCIKAMAEPTRRFVNQTISRRNASSNPEGLQALQEALGLASPPLLMECFDMSNISGSLAVGSMVRFRHGRPATAEYRRYRIRSEAAADDTAFMHEVLIRRYGRLQREGLAFPDLVIVDGGESQLAVAQDVFAGLGVSSVPLIGLAKKQELIIRPNASEPLELPRHHAGLKLLQAIRDEAHRFANAYHRELRNRRITDSILNDIPGIGPVRRRQLLTACGSVREMARLTPEQMAQAVPGIGRDTAERVIAFLQTALGPP